MTILVPMSEVVFRRYLESSTAGYAESNVRSGRWPKEGALERSREAFARLLPRGLATPDNHFFELKETVDGPQAGVLWYAIRRDEPVPAAFVYEILVHPGFRRRGHAAAAFRDLETRARAQGAATIGLHVFGYNAEARALYEKLDFTVTSVIMNKPLGGS